MHGRRGGPTPRSYYFIGKDNIVFHAVIWPCQLMGYGGLNLPTDVPANQYVTFRGDKASASRGVGRSIGWYTDRLEPDSIRYALTSALPEQNDSEFSDDLMIERINAELVATWGNLVNRVLSLTAKNFDGEVPSPGEVADADRTVREDSQAVVDEVGRLIERVELRAGLRRGMEAAAAVNAYLNATEPWSLVKSDPKRAATVLWTAIQCIAAVRVALAPYLPFSTRTLGETLGIGDVDSWSVPEVAAGTRLGEVKPLFTKLDPETLDD